MTNYKVGDKVRILNTSAILFGSEYWRNGDVREVVRVDGDGDICVRKNGGSLDWFIITREEFHAIELVTETPKLTKKSHIEALERRIEELERQLRKVAS